MHTNTALDGTSTLAVGQPLRVTVTDGDMDFTRDAPDTVSATLQSMSNTGTAATIDQRIIALVETAASSGIFTGQMDTVLGSPMCDVRRLGVFSQAGQMIRAWYDEVAPAGRISATPSLTLTWPATLEILENRTYVGTVITVRLVDRDLVGTSSPVTISFESSNAKTAIPLISVVATAANSDTFTGTLAISSVRILILRCCTL